MRGEPLDRVDLLKGQLVDIADDGRLRPRPSSPTGTVHARSRAISSSRLLAAVDMIERQAPQGDDCLNALAEHVARTRGPAGVGGFTQRLGLFASDMVALDEAVRTAAGRRLYGRSLAPAADPLGHWRPLALLWFADYRRAIAEPEPGRHGARSMPRPAALPPYIGAAWP